MNTFPGARSIHHRRMLVAAAVLAVTVVVVTPGAADAQNQASGTFTVKGASTTFAHAYAFWKTNVFSGKPDLIVLCSDVAIPPEAMPVDNDGFAKIAGLIRDGKVHAIELHLAPGHKQLDRAEDVSVYHVGLSPARFGMGGVTTYEAMSVTATTVEGRARTTSPQTHEGVKWQFDLRFKVTIPPPGKVS
jgi:hypothetical protein